MSPEKVRHSTACFIMNIYNVLGSSQLLGLNTIIYTPRSTTLTKDTVFVAFELVNLVEFRVLVTLHVYRVVYFIKFYMVVEEFVQEMSLST